jgi:hypothetical protein
VTNAELTPLPLLEDADVGCDGHGVLADPQGVKQKAAKSETSRQFPRWVLKGSLMDSALGKDVAERVREKTFEVWDYFRWSKEVRGALDGIKKIHKAMAKVGVKKRIRVVSSSGPNAYMNLCRWCDRRRGLGRNYAHVVSSGRDGIKQAHAVGLTFFLEDDVEKLEKLRGTVPNLRLLKTIYTKDLPLPPDVKLVTWGQFADEVVEWILNTYR